MRTHRRRRSATLDAAARAPLMSSRRANPIKAYHSPKWRLATTVVTAMTVGSTAASAQTPSAQTQDPAPSEAPSPGDASRERARQLAEKGARAFDRGAYRIALDKLRAAEALVPVPTIGIEVARTLEALDRLVEAAAAYRRVEDMSLPADMPERFREVQRERQRDARRARRSGEQGWVSRGHAPVSRRR